MEVEFFIYGLRVKFCMIGLVKIRLRDSVVVEIDDDDDDLFGIMWRKVR